MRFLTAAPADRKSSPSPCDLPPCSSEPQYIRSPVCLISWPAWKITSLGLFWPAWLHKAPPNPAACPQLIFLLATLLTAPPTDYARGMSEERRIALVEPWSASSPEGLQSPCFWYKHPPSAWHRPFTSCVLIKQPTRQLRSSLPVQFSDFTPPTETPIIQLSHLLILCFLLSDVPPNPSTSAAFHFTQ